MIWKSYIQTYDGDKLDIKNPNPDHLKIPTIIHGLCLEPRFACQTIFNIPYVVAQHSIYVCGLAPENLKLEALMHDWVEFIGKDIPGPIKRSLLNYKSFEKRLEKLGAKLWKLDTSKESKNIIKVIDKRLALTEEKSLMRHQFIKEEEGYKDLIPYPFTINIWSYNECYEKFWALWEKYKRI